MSEPEWLDGPQFVTWLEERERGTTLCAAGGPDARDLMYRWRKGRRASVWAADKVLTARGLHISLLPDRLWLTEPRVRNAKFAKETRESAARLRRQGLTHRQVSEVIGVKKRTVEQWTKDSRQKAARSARSGSV